MIYWVGMSDNAVKREFPNPFGAFKCIDLEATFRRSGCILAVETDFLLRNPAQKGHQAVRVTQKADGSTVHVGRPGEGGLSLQKEALDRIVVNGARRDGTTDMLLLGRLPVLAGPEPRSRINCAEFPEAPTPGQ